MTTKPTISVVIPTYNHAGYLGEALRSLRDQTRGDWEAIVVNNYSEDETIQVVESFADPRIRLENFRNNGIIGASRNRAIELARGEFIAFLDSDDLWLPRKLELCMPHFRSPVGLVCHDLERFGRASGVIHCGPSGRATFDGLLAHGSCITPSAAIVRTDLLRGVGGFSEAVDTVTAEDYHLWLKLAAAGAVMTFTSEVLGRYRVHASSQSASALRHMDAVNSVLEEFTAHPASTLSPNGPAMRRRRAQVAYGAARSLYSSGDFQGAGKLFLKSLSIDPFNGRSYAAIALNTYSALRSGRRS